ncbi:MAG: hypothetical protein Greene101449_149 [Candidatus Peregrinibacteria bacterium Greene1014_49]|nr:MAG: hypothetical protein Greene101449_149 [Candidatus Peregrinibacteria bacterium Greene1014_49]
MQCITENKPAGIQALTWFPGGFLPYRLREYAAVAALGKMWVIGGKDYNSGQATNQVYATTDGYSWNIVGNFPSKIHAASAIGWNGELWVVGGMTCNMYGRSCVASRATFHSTDGITWQQGPILPAGSRNNNVPLYVLNGKLFVGSNIATMVNNSPVYNVYVLESITGAWQVAGTAFGSNTVAFGNRVLALNGRAIMSSPTGVAPWTTQSILPSTLSTNAQLSIANTANLLTNGNYILALGNAFVLNRNPNCDKVVLSSDNGIRWAKATTPNCSVTPAYNLKAVTFLNRAWIFTDRYVYYAELPPLFLACGDSLVQTGEECDDGNQTNTDACTNVCKNAKCGDTFVKPPDEECDDGNTNNLDSCPNDCLLAVCGDSLKEGLEQCDDGNTSSTDGCDSSCIREFGFTCTGDTLSVCTVNCSNGVLNGNEQCDDRNLLPGDGCSGLCTLEPGFTCSIATPTVCTPIVCGNGIAETGEQCDDGNTSDTDGWCASDCKNPGKISCTLPTLLTISFAQSTVDTERSDQVVAADFDGNGLLEFAVRKGAVLKLFQKSGTTFAMTWSKRFVRSNSTGTIEDANDRGYIEAFDNPRGTRTNLVALIQSSLYPNLSNPLPGYHENNHYILSMGGNGFSDQNLSWLRRSSRASNPFALTRPGGFLGSIYRGTAATTAYQPLEYIDNLAAQNSTRRVLSFDTGFGNRPLIAYTSISRNLWNNGKHIIATGKFLIDDATAVVTTLETDEAATEVEVGDISGDGELDIVAVIKKGTPGSSKLKWWNPLNNTWFFIADISWTRPGIAVVDVDGDGDRDVVVQSNNTTQGAVQWMEQQSGQWIPHILHEGSVNDFNAADLTGDGRIDIVVATPTGIVLYTQAQQCFAPSVCANGIKEFDEGCDDNNAVPSDGCSATCTVEAGFGCAGEPLSVCALNCGNGTIQLGEGCDDNDRDVGDGCNATCAVETGYACTGIPSVCARMCGNGQVNPGEACDDGNRTAGDGCSTECRQESGYICSSSPSTCVLQCGNGTVNTLFNETCDDGNRTAEDGCNAECRNEQGFACVGTAPSVCTRLCGNGSITEGEECDDQSRIAGDGCSASCQVESGYVCIGTPSACRIPLPCGNGVKQTNEQCDDNNVAAGDGCSALCTVEPGYSCTGTERSTCRLNCGNGTIQDGEICDDGRPPLAGDGCSAACTVESGFTCTGSPSICTTPPPMPLSQTCNSTQTSRSLGAITQTSRLTGVVVASFGDEAYGIVGVTQSSGTLIPTIYRYTKVNQTPSWVAEARLSQIATASTFGGPGAALIKTGGRLYAIRRGRSGDISQPGSTGNILRRTAGGIWEDLGTLWQSPSSAPINSILDFKGTLYAAHNGRVYQYNGNRNWAPVGSPLSNPLLLTNTNDRLYVIGSVTEGTMTVNTMHRLDGSTWVADTGAAALRRISNVVGAGNALLLLGKYDASNSATEPYGVYRYQPGADVPLTDTRVEATPTVARLNPNSTVLQPQLFSIADRPFAFIRGTSLLQYNAAAQIWQDTGLWGVSNPRLLDEGPLILSTSLTFQTEFKSALVVCKKLVIPFCGNGAIESGETCDDRNEINTDGCTNACRLPACGDGFIQGTEECDDGNLLNEDSCTPECKIDPNWCAPGSCTSPVSLSEVCTDSVNPVPLGTIKKTTGTTTSIVSFNNSAYMATDNRIRRLMRNGNRVSWITEAQIQSSSITLKSINGTLYAIVTAPYAGSITQTDSMVYRRNANGQWEGLGTPFVPTSVINPNAPNIVNLLEHNGVLYAAVRNYGNVYRYNNDHTWSRLGANIAIAANTQGLLPLKAAVWGGNTLYAIIDVQSVGAAMPETVFQAMEANGQAFVVGLPRFVTNFMVYRMNIETPNSFLTGVYFRTGSAPSFVSADNQLFASNGIGNIVHYGGTDTMFAERQSNNDPAYTVNDGSLLLAAPVDSTNTILPSCKKLILSICRNGIVERGEECDDNNASNTDGCTNICKFPACGDGFMQGTESCDDRNPTTGDGCNATCAIEPDYTCSGSPSVCLPTCGNGVINTGEACDDRNRTAGDGCNLTCSIETSHTCSGAPSVCVRICGNGVLNTGEICDDNNANANDGCSATCGVEGGYTCSGTPSVCVRICGNGAINAGETCDDGNASDNDGCTSLCAIQSGWRCQGSPSVCTRPIYPTCSFSYGMDRVSCPTGAMPRCTAADTPFPVCLNGMPTCCSSGLIRNGDHCGLSPTC